MFLKLLSSILTEKLQKSRHGMRFPILKIRMNHGCLHAGGWPGTKNFTTFRVLTKSDVSLYSNIGAEND
jgi:hypothetical protein